MGAAELRVGKLLRRQRYRGRPSPTTENQPFWAEYFAKLRNIPPNPTQDFVHRPHHSWAMTMVRRVGQIIRRGQEVVEPRSTKDRP